MVPAREKIARAAFQMMSGHLSLKGLRSAIALQLSNCLIVLKSLADRWLWALNSLRRFACFVSLSSPLTFRPNAQHTSRERRSRWSGSNSPWRSDTPEIGSIHSETCWIGLSWRIILFRIREMKSRSIHSSSTHPFFIPLLLRSNQWPVLIRNIVDRRVLLYANGRERRGIEHHLPPISTPGRNRRLFYCLNPSLI